MKPIDQVRWIWITHYACNYNCTYCNNHENVRTTLIKPVYFPYEKWITQWKKTLSRYKTHNITIVGGEPFLYPGFKHILKTIADLTHIIMATNMSVDFTDIISSVHPKSIYLICSFHPEYADTEQFLERVKAIQKANWEFTINLVAHPNHIDKIPAFKELFSKNALPLDIGLFWGTWKDQKYPEAYTTKERSIIDRHSKNEKMEPFYTKGKLCYAGRFGADILPNGDVIPCGKSVVNIGNFFDDDFKLNMAPTPCPSPQCDCGTWKFLLVPPEEVEKHSNHQK